MMKILRTVVVLGSVGSLATLAMAQDKQSEAFGSDVSALLAKLEAQCAHRRRTMPPDERDDCARKLREAQLRYGQGGDSAGNSTPGQAPGVGPGIGGGQGNGIGLGIGGGQGNGIGLGVGGGGGQGKGGR